MFVSRINTLLDEKSRNERRRVTQVELADFLGVTRQAVSALASYRGVKTLNADTIMQLCDFFALEPGDYYELFDLLPEGDTNDNGLKE